jgi:hypothetical protein
MHNLESEIAEWRRAMIEGGVTDLAVLDELESHLRDHVEQQVRAGCDVGAAFQTGVARIGQPAALKREFLRADKGLSAGRVAAFLNDRRKCLWFTLGFALLIAVGFYARNARVTPAYASEATVELQGLRQPRRGGEIRAAELLNTSIQLLCSQRVRARLAPREQPSPWLGGIGVRTTPSTFLVTLSVFHEDPEAAALVANRYMQEWKNELANSTNFEGISVREIDVATPRRAPITPNLKRIFRESLGLAAVTFLGLMVVAALLRKLVQTRPGHGPQWNVG